MGKAVIAWRDERLDALAVKLEPLPTQIAVLTASVERLAEENRVLRAELAAAQRQLVQISWVLIAALIGGAASIAGALL